MEKNQSTWDQISFLLGALGLVVSSLFLRMGTDPFNLPKMMFLSIGACTILFLVINNFLITRQRVDKKVTIVATVFSIALLNSFLFSGAPLTQQFFGAYGRNTGLLTLIMLLILFVASTQLYRKAETRPPPMRGPGFSSRSLPDQRGLTPLPSSGS